jgi:hypothetical protein
MSVEAFVLGLFEGGQVEVPDIEPLCTSDLNAASSAIQCFEPDYRLSLAGEPPLLDQDAAMWSATKLYRASQLLLFRDHDAATVDRELDPKCPSLDGASAHYSVDLLMRFLPDLVRLARSVAKDDPLVTHLLKWASDWPLSSVGIEQIQVEQRARDVLDHPSLLTLYVDRIIERKDTSRLTDSKVTDAVRQAIGWHRDLAPEIYRALQPEGSEHLGR